MRNILVTGAGGFLGKSLSEYFNQRGYRVYACTRKELDVSNSEQVYQWFRENPVDVVLHTAVKGGRRNHKDSPEDFIANLKMFNNLLENKDHYSILINFGSGAEFDRKKNIDRCAESEIFTSDPSDYYGRSKNLITRTIVRTDENLYNFRLFGCFGANEAEDRLIKVIKHGIENNTEVSIDSKKEMDFFYDQDVCKAIEFYITNFNKKNLPKDINLVYEQKFNLRKISDIVENEMNSSNPNLILRNEEVKNYTGDATLFSQTFPPGIFTGFLAAVAEVCK